jgi:hypothetical protein
MWKKHGQPKNSLVRGGNQLVITLCKEETGVLVMELLKQLWPEDIQSAMPVNTGPDR